MRRFITRTIGRLLAKFISHKWANRWLAWRGSRIRYYSKFRLFIDGVEFKEVDKRGRPIE